MRSSCSRWLAGGRTTRTRRSRLGSGRTCCDASVARRSRRRGWRASWPGTTARCAGSTRLPTAGCSGRVGSMHVVHEDGNEIEIAPGSAYEILPGHDAWVVGDERCDMFEFESRAAEQYARIVSGAIGYRRRLRYPIRHPVLAGQAPPVVTSWLGRGSLSVQPRLWSRCERRLPPDCSCPTQQARLARSSLVAAPVGHTGPPPADQRDARANAKAGRNPTGRIRPAPRQLRNGERRSKPAAGRQEYARARHRVVAIGVVSSEIAEIMKAVVGEMRCMRASLLCQAECRGNAVGVVEEVVDASDEVAFEAADRFSVRLAVLALFGQVDRGPGVV